MIDLHTHSNKSDGSFTPAELIDLAVQKGITYIALTDHDSIEGIDEAKRRAEEISSSSDTKITVIPGIEFSTDWNGRDVHVVGLNIDHTNKVFVGKLDFFLDYTFPMVRIREVVSQNINIAGYTLQVSAAEEEGLLAAAMILGGSLPMGLLFIRGLLGIYSLITGGHKKYYALMPGLSLILTASVTVLVRNSLQDYMEKMIGKASGMLDILGKE